MKTIQVEILQTLVGWFNRKTTSNAVRRVGGLLSLALSTDMGQVRSENQDRCAILRTRNKGGKALVIAVVCDGMGGMESGSDCASKAIATFLYHCAYSVNEPTDILLENAVLKANEAVFSDHEGRGGATLSAFCVDGEGRLVGVNVGDSRIYCFEDGDLAQISTDDTLAGQFGNDSNEFLNRSELLLQHVGVGNDIEPHILPIEIPKGRDMQLLLTSDGIHFLDDYLIASIIKYATEPAKAAKRLMELSKWCGGKDNATIVIASSYDQLRAFSENSKPDVFEIWDPFGELQFFSFALQDTPETKISDVHDVQSTIKDEKLNKPKKVRKKRRAKVKKPAGSKGSNDRGKKNKPKPSSGSNGKPQLNIKFDATQGE